MGAVQVENEIKDKTEVHKDVQERIMRQALEALWFEDIIDCKKQGSEWGTTGIDGQGQPVQYTCKAQQKYSFGRVKIVKGSIQKEGVPMTDLNRFLEEMILNKLTGAHVDSFIQELLETLAKDSQCRAVLAESIPIVDHHYDALESHMTDGHLYHPSYKSRLGFTLKDNLAYGPEFNMDVPLYWLAVKQTLVQTALSKGCRSDDLVGQHLMEADVRRFNRVLQGESVLKLGDVNVAEGGIVDNTSISSNINSNSGDSDNSSSSSSDGEGVAHIDAHGNPYVFIPVHPWQWEHQLQSVFAVQLLEKDIIFLGASSSSYRAQQSIRSLSNRVNSSAPYIKLALSITNTSSTRILAQHTTQNAPLISDWLEQLIQEDELLQQEQFAILKEIMGLSFRYEQLSVIQYRRAYGTFGAIWRENVTTHLHEGETAWPLNALMLVQPNGVPFIQAAIERHGIVKWSEALVRTITLPIIHLLYAHGIALESHAQNIILVLENDLPKRMIVKDLHDGVRYVPDKLLHPERAPELHPVPETHRKFNRYSFIYAEDVSEVRDYTYDAFFFICMTDIALALEPFGLSEEAFWQLSAGVIVDYHQQHPEYSERFAWFDLFGEDALIEEMTKRRLYGDGELYFRKVSNPLKRAKDTLA
ncbi:IucA/IucC family siderophore biosynthesis protein [Paenibacillus sp. ACRSA]|uniref:IucA/IucC family protein n=1 Tax=Paenibacillus sp. ACRSA TaxID=2918211 RepID=UPI001EF569CE|nr:IucA/IucC family siderophore biosynthesis protein [Paenibacillus sp. ACRSA]